MNNNLSISTLSALLSAGILCTACTENMPAPSAPATAVARPSITGLVQPAGGVLGVSLLDNVSHQSIASASVDGNSGAYHFDSLPAGTYTLGFGRSPNYVPPRDQSVTVTAGNTTVVPAISVVRSTASFNAAGTAFTPTLIGLDLGAGSYFSLVLSSGYQGTTQTAPDGYRLLVSMPYTIAVGTYNLNSTLTNAVFIGLI